MQRSYISYSTTIIIQQESVKKSSILLYPNPVKDNLYVQLISENSVSEKKSLLIIDITGKVIAQQTVTSNNTNKINVRNLKPGNYLLSITNASGNVETIKFMVE